jgi:hypothetical protein
MEQPVQEEARNWWAPNKKMKIWRKYNDQAPVRSISGPFHLGERKFQTYPFLGFTPAASRQKNRGQKDKAKTLVSYFSAHHFFASFL